MNTFAENQLGDPETLSLFRNTAEQLYGGPVELVTGAEDGAGRLASRSLEELRRFKQVKFI